MEFIRSHLPIGTPDHMELVGRVDATGLLREIDVPTLVVVAGGDRLVPPDISHLFAAIPGSQVIECPEAGHIFTPAETAAWTADVAHFLTGLTALS